MHASHSLHPEKGEEPETPLKSIWDFVAAADLMLEALRCFDKWTAANKERSKTNADCNFQRNIMEL